VSAERHIQDKNKGTNWLVQKGRNSEDDKKQQKAKSTLLRRSKDFTTAPQYFATII
jgi:hypothetical protein